MKGEKMTKITTMDLAPLYRNSIGIDNWLSRVLDQIDHNNGQANYPPYNIIKHDENTFEVQVAVSGFGEGEVEITVKDGTLIISGEKQPEQVDQGIEYLYQGISARRFVRTFSLADYVEVLNATNANGILSVRLERKLPEAMKPKTIAITYKK
jgi:molecular chaperone IbpA